MPRLRLPNGYGSIQKIKGRKLRNPFRVRVRQSDPFSLDGKQQWINVGYCASYEEALAMLAAWHKHPITTNDSLTFAEAYEKWMSSKQDTISDRTVAVYRAAYENLTSLHNIPMNELTFRRIEDCFRKSKLNTPTLHLCKVVLSAVFKWCVLHDIVTPDFDKTRYLDINFAGNPRKQTKTIFTSQEIETLWQHSDLSEVQHVLILIYTGLRIDSFLALQRRDVYIDEGYIDVVGTKNNQGKATSKTQAGVRRIPIADKILPIVQALCARGTKYLIGNKRMYRDYYVKHFFNPACKLLGVRHTPHECRHTFVSLLDSADVNKTTIKMLAGHSSQDLTERVYTHKTMDELRAAINKI